MAIGEAGSLSANTTSAEAPISVSFTEPLKDPIISLTATNKGGNTYVFRVLSLQTDANGDTTGFTFTLEEWEYEDGPHPAVEDINWIAVEEGVHTLPDGRVIEAGRADADEGTTTVGFGGTFNTAPVVLTQVMSNRDPITVDSDPFNITSTGFTLSLQEEQAQDGSHGSESVGWIAVEPGRGAVTHPTLDESRDIIGLGGVFSDPVSVADTQTLNDPDPGTVIINGGNGTSTIGLFFQEERSADNEQNHANEVVGIVTFESGVIPCFTPGTVIETPYGPRPIMDLQQGDLVLTEDAGPQPIRVICRTRLDSERLARDPGLKPITIRAGALGAGLPDRDMIVSPQHRMLVSGWRVQTCFGEDEVLAPARGLLNDHSVLVDHRCTHVDYIHLGLDRHHVLRANGALTESLHAGGMEKSALDEAAREELFAIFPQLRSAPSQWGRAARPILTVRETAALA